ncbi:hypothetical protein MPSEU_000006700 [Mayamaea pseudoterrestris]|nr:hypothetical protein MPSEU_000006700 [Mayamaea pseudoterrestris]
MEGAMKVSTVAINSSCGSGSRRVVSTQTRSSLSICFRRIIFVIQLLLLLMETSHAVANGNRLNSLLGRIRRGQPADEELYSGQDTQASFGTGREFSLFDARARDNVRVTVPKDDDHFQFPDEESSFYESIQVNDSSSNRQGQQNTFTFPSSSSSRRSTATTSPPAYIPDNNKPTGRSSSTNPYFDSRRRKRQPKSARSSSSMFYSPLTDWWHQTIAPNIKAWPRLQCRVEPTTTLKIRKTFYPLKTIVKFGADFNTQLGVWQFKSSWEDAIIGGKLTLIAGRELQLTKSWALSVGGVDDLVTRLRFRAAVDLQTWKAYARVGFRTERLSPINVMEGFTLVKRLPLDGHKGHVKLEVKANLALPEPEIEYSTETQRSLIGMGDIQMNIEELNLVLDY